MVSLPRPLASGSGATQQGPELFGRVRDVSIDDAGNILVLDDQARDVRVFASDGTHVQTFGGPGDGPGELADVTAIQWLADGRLLVLGRPRRGNLFERTPTGFRVVRPLEVMVDAPEVMRIGGPAHLRKPRYSTFSSPSKSAS